MPDVTLAVTAAAIDSIVGDAGLTAIGGLTPAADRLPYFTGSSTATLATFTAAGRALMDDADAAAQRTTLGLGTIATQAANSVTITGGAISGVTDIAVADGGTGASTAADARTNLGLGTAATASAEALRSFAGVNAQTGTTYTLVIGDAGDLVTMDNASANTLTIPANASVAFAVGTVIAVAQIGAGATTIEGASGVTVNGVSAGSGDLTARWGAVTLVKTGTDAWLALGAIGAVA